MIFLGGETIAELPSFTVKSDCDCDVPPHPLEELEHATKPPPPPKGEI